MIISIMCQHLEIIRGTRRNIGHCHGSVRARVQLGVEVYAVGPGTDQVAGDGGIGGGIPSEAHALRRQRRRAQHKAQARDESGDQITVRNAFRTKFIKLLNHNCVI